MKQLLNQPATAKVALTALTLGALNLAALVAAPPAQAGDFEVGCKQYAAKDYKGAKVSFEKVVKAYPNFAQAHYYLGNILMSSGQSAQAKQEYQACLDAHPDATTAGYCQTILGKLGSPRSGSTGSSSSSSSASSTPAVSASSNAGADSGQSSDAARRKKIIMDKANQEIAELRAECKERMEKGNGSGETTHKYVKPDGTVFYDLDPETRAAVQKEYDQKIEKIREMAEYQCKFIK
ncbi:MAG: Tetratricopeptide repeat protein [Cyanobacteriota bacterium erpe_2018_sw_21hr_WHONDRS-SW48-000092_B_bin.40]|jgi:tetratricopeptide (TPR) repeat protein|nr:Tetratricopeptide repeat protein [Cyanobacteriota bacterium erpe_2018_sw_21hr_WHONDRS-SW48-000092_B_bin.40]